MDYVIPAKAGIQGHTHDAFGRAALDSRLRGNDGVGVRGIVIVAALEGEVHTSLSVVIPGLDPGTQRSRPPL